MAVTVVYRGHWSVLVCLRKPQLSGNGGGAVCGEAGGRHRGMEQGCVCVCERERERECVCDREKVGLRN